MLVVPMTAMLLVALPFSTDSDDSSSREGRSGGMASGVEVILLLVQILNLAIWTYLLVRSRGKSL